MSNRAAREIYPPGSTFKLVTAAAGLAAGKTPDSKIKSPDRLRLPNTNTFLPNSTNCGGSETTLVRALEVSCNTAFANLGIELGEDALRAQADKFGFDQRHLSDLNGVASRFPDNMDGAQTALSSIGQFDVAASPLQMAMVTAAIANDGELMDPYVVSMVQSPNLTPLSTHKPTRLSQPMTAENARLLKGMMVSVVSNGTGRNAAISGVDVGGKTGTAQSDPKRKPFAWFTSFAPADDPKVAVAVVVEDANIPRSDIAGGRVAAPIAKAVMEAAL
jgi:peptidoglycan glycosyltransferase